MGHFRTTEKSWIHEEWSPDEWNNDWSLDKWNDEWIGVGWHENYERLCNTSVDRTISSFSFESPERVNANLDTGATVDTFLSNFDREGVEDGRFNDWITHVKTGTEGEESPKE